MTQQANKPNDLVLTREVDVDRERLWRAWTDPDLLKQWWAPRPFTTVECSLDPRPGGLFSAVMRDPDGKDYPMQGCVLEAEKPSRLVMTDALLEDYRPSGQPFFTAVVTLEDLGGGRTRYTARAIHKNEEDRRRHEEMGFHSGWGQCLDQLVEVASKQR
ncbi:SRPBCC family protein [Chitinimonas lacunae]|uniref:SRPBCC family protein n=1 Tax=Chitinimonas lacunae TaxID=1963018 RepID=A0ABV8MTB7_9NEIS